MGDIGNKDGAPPARRRTAAKKAARKKKAFKDVDPDPAVVGDLVLEEIPATEKRLGEKKKRLPTLPVVTTNPNSIEIVSQSSITDEVGCRSSTPRSVLPTPSSSLVRGPDYIAVCPSSLDLTQEICSGWQGPSLKGGLVRVLEDHDLPVVHQSCRRSAVSYTHLTLPTTPYV